MDSLLTRLVHIDFKGAPVKLEYLKEVVKFLKKYGLNGLLLEYEDMFPYQGSLKIISRSDAYSINELTNFLQFCHEQDIIVIPLVQTFGHLEFVLKHERLRSLRENYKSPRTICPSLSESLNIIKQMIDQIVAFHPFSKSIHIGADEVYDFNNCDSCKLRDLDKSRLFLDHVLQIAYHVKHKNLLPIMWDDMLRDIDPGLIRACRLKDFVELMIWNYTPALNLDEEYFDSMLSIFPRVWAASAFKGANGAVQQIVNTSVYVKNNQSWLSRIKTSNQKGKGQFIGIALTGWSRFDHFASLCEILPCSIPCLSLCLQIITTGSFTVEIHEKLSKSMGFPELIPWEPLIKCVDPGCLLTFPGYEIYQAMSGWYLLTCEMNQLIGSDFINGWMSKYHRQHLIGNSVTIEYLLKQIEDMYSRMDSWKEVFEGSFRSVFVEDAVKEWFECNMNNKLEKLKKRIRQANQLVGVGDSVFERTSMDDGDCQ